MILDPWRSVDVGHGAQTKLPGGAHDACPSLHTWILKVRDKGGNLVCEISTKGFTLLFLRMVFE